MSRLDYFLIPFSSANNIESCKILPGVLSDHSFIQIMISLDEEKRGRGLWKLNTSLLSDIKYVEQVNDIINRNFIDANTNNIMERWELFKIDIAEFTMQYSKEKALRRRNKISELNGILKQAMQKFNNLNLNSPTIMTQINDWNEVIDAIKSELDKEALYALRGALLRSKIKWVSEGEKVPSTF